MEADILQYLPTWFRSIADFRAVMETETGELELLAACMDAVRSNFYLSTADAGTVSGYEAMLHIVPNPATESIAFRRARVINRLSTAPPFSLRFLYARLDLMIGKGKWSVMLDYENYTLYVEAAAENQAWAVEVEATVATIKPCHIVYLNRPLMAAELTLSEGVSLFYPAFHYRLGEWSLGTRPFADEEKKEVVKMESQLSLQPALIGGVADFVAGDVAAARVNGSVLIGNITKAVYGGQTVITYLVRTEDAAMVTRVELLDAGGNVLTCSDVYVPIAGNAVLKHTIWTKEAL